MTQPSNNGKGPFVFSRWLPEPVFDFWLGWFAERGVPAGVVSRRKPQTYPITKEYALWRTGRDSVEYGKRPKFTRDMKCDRSVNGFIDQFDKKYREVHDGDARRAAKR